jgi:SP family facilitated glucose transporter-like MFS transporter 1
MNMFLFSHIHCIYTFDGYIGGLIGGLSGGTLADLLGRKTLLWLNNFVFIVAIALMSLFSNFYVFTAGRLLIGWGSGYTTVVVPMYLSETAPTRLRGAIGVFPQLLCTIGIFVSQVLGIFLSTRPVGWRMLLGWTVVLPIAQMIVLPLCPESPRWLLSRNRVEAARRALAALRQSSDIDAELDSMASSGGEKSSIKHLFDKRLVRFLIVGVGIHVFQQLSGVNAVFFYSMYINTIAGQSGLTYISK